ncbi:prepilin-type N-terminal cleavage/methylation domain-containing protein [Candidatus Babeliales bacterium]|nr:prepilin-type N-terminal cleavage/methylation domain-containing protein [Candidatus Babeliales bacterium]
MNKQSGFSVIEMLISMMLSAMLMTAALTIYNQINKGVNKVDLIATNDSAIMIFHNRITQDLAGLYPLWLAQKPSEETPKEPNQNAKEQEKPKDSNPAETTQQNEQGLKALFLYAPEKKDQKHFDYITFITSNPMQTYPAQGQQSVRVVYKVVSDPNQPSAFMIQRKEETSISPYIDPEKIMGGDFYTIVSSVQSIQIEYGFIEKSPEERKKNPDDPWTLKWVSSWGSSDKTSSENYIPTMPDAVRIKITLIRKADQKTFDYESYCMIPVCKEKPFELVKIDKNNTAKTLPKESPAPKDSNASHTEITVATTQG